MYLTNGTLLQGGKYTIKKFLGQGGFGITYLAEHELLGTKVAIKEFFMKDFCNRDETISQVQVGTESSREQVDKFREKFLKEARNIAKLHHPNIVRISDVFEENGTAYYVMEYCEGGSLSELIKHHLAGIEESLALKYIRQVASALSQIHAQKMNHLDVKPANILLDAQGNAVLIDFGLSKQYDATGNQTSTTPVGISHGYAPIEQYKVGGVSEFSPATDIYSLGATLYKLITGQTPPEAHLLLEEDLPAFSASEGVTNAIRQAMQVRSVNRPQSISEFVQLLDGQSVPSSNDGSQPTVGVLSDENEESTQVVGTPTVKKTGKRKTKEEKKAKVQEQDANKKEENIDVNDSIDGNVESVTHKRSPKKKVGFWLKIFLFTVCAFVVFFLAVSQVDTDETSEKPTVSRVVNQTFKDSTGETFTYTGEVVKGKPNGMGEGVYSFGQYVGPYKNGLMHGADGKFTEKGGATFVGTFRNDYYYDGRLTRSDGSYFVGQMKDGTPYKGTEYYKNGKVKKQL